MARAKLADIVRIIRLAAERPGFDVVELKNSFLAATPSIGPDDRSYYYSYMRNLSDLYVVDGVK